MSEYCPKIKRNELGLIEGVEYKYDESGFINWRGMIASEFLFPNKGWFEARNQTPPSSIDGLEDAQLLIKLGGIKELARLRGFSSVKYEVLRCDNEYVAAKCGIKWLPNYECPQEVYFEDMANATVNNTSNFGVKFLETIAANRAFVRAVRNFLNIHIVGSDEIDSSKKPVSFSESEKYEVTMPSPQNALETAAKKAGINTFVKFQEYLFNAERMGVYKNPKAEEWTDYESIPAKEARILISTLQE